MVLVLSFAIPAAINSYLKSLGPLDLMSWRAGSTVVVDRDGRLLRPFAMANGRWRLPVTHSAVDPALSGDAVAYEDARFRQHNGVDLLALGRAAMQSGARGRIVSGGSTLTMQVARLIEPRERTLSAKLRQLVRAWQMERTISKDGVLDRYLTLAPFGGNLEGVRAASLAYFGKEPRRLTIGEAALSWRCRNRRRRAARTNILRPRGWRGAHVLHARSRAASSPRTKPKPPSTSRSRAAGANFRRSPRMRRKRRSPPTNRRQTNNLTIDARLQEKLEALAKEHAERLGPKFRSRSSPSTSQRRNPRPRRRRRLRDASRDGDVDMSRAPRSPGSALKPFIYALAFEQGLAHPETILFDRPARYGAYAPENFDLGFRGPVTARHALQMSLNLPAIEVLADVGPSSFLARLHGAGAEIVLPKDTPIGLAIGLGGLGHFARRYRAALFGPRARRRGAGALPNGSTARPTDRPARRVTDTVAAYYIDDILRGAPPPPNALSGRIAFKTGTSYGFRDALAIGYDKQTTIAVWVGRPDNGATPGLIGREIRRADPVRRLRATRPRSRAHSGAQRAFSRGDLGRTAAASCAISGRTRRRRSPPPNARRSKYRFRPTERRSISTAARKPLSMKALGGQLPLAWFVNGAPGHAGRFSPSVRVETRRRGVCARDGDRRQGRDGFGADPHRVRRAVAAAADRLADAPTISLEQRPMMQGWAHEPRGAPPRRGLRGRSRAKRGGGGLPRESSFATAATS